MRTLTNTFDAAAVHVGGGRESAIELQDLSYAVGDPAQAEIEHVARRSPVCNAMRIVGILAFGQSLLFLVIWLLMCASAGAATPAKKVEYNPPLQVSTFEPTKTRDPFTPSPVVGVDTRVPISTPLIFQLEGILYSSVNPSAIVNGQLVTLNKTVTLRSGTVNVPVKVTAITRQRVTLEANGQKVELQMDSETAPSNPATNQ